MDLSASTSSSVSLLIENLAPDALSFIRFDGIDEKLKEWRKMLLSIEAVVEDAEERQLSESSVRLWLRDVQNLVYEIEDFVDDLATSARRQPQMMMMMMDKPDLTPPFKIRKLFSRFNPFKTLAAIRFNHFAERRMSEITNTLLELEKTKYNLGLQKFFAGKSVRKADLRLPSTSLMGPAFVEGREEEIAAILTWLLEDGSTDCHGKLRIISIVGMGGIGKTTLAQCLYHNEQVRERFSDRAWVCVAQDFDAFEICKNIYEELYKTSCDLSDFNTVQMELHEKLSNKKFLLVLDDVWNQDFAKWDLLCAPFHAAAPGSTIMVTTRNHDVARIIGSTDVFDLLMLPDSDCVSLLAQHALQRPNFDMHPELKEVGEVIAKRCKGLPLAAKTLGGLLRTKRSSKQWIEVATSKIWELRDDAIIPALRISYHQLPPYLKPLFAYSSLFPKGYEFDKQELILLWMAQGLLKQAPERRQWQMEDLGCEYFNDLVSMSFFQQSTGNKSRFIMHDLNNDLAQFVAGLTYLRLDDETVADAPYKVSEEARHASFISHKYGDFKKFKALNAARCLRTLLPLREKSSSHSYLSNLLLKDFPRLIRLRALSFNGYYIRELPKSIGDLSHLRYLDLSRTDITQLAESLCDLYNLQTLLLHGCSKLVQLPTSTHKLISLRHLSIAHTPSLKEMPRGIGMLTNLRTLSKFIVNNSSGRKISELKSLHCLQGTLSIFGIQNVTNIQDAFEANILHKKGLSQLEMNWSRAFDDTRDEVLEFEVLDALKPQTTLASLEIEFYGGQKFPSWVGHRLFCDMVKVRLIGSKNCTYLPPLGQLTSLRELYIEGMDRVRVVGPEFFAIDSLHSVAFQSLINLSFMDMDRWEEWFADSTNGYEGAFPRLEELQISACKKLNKVSLAKIPSLRALDLYGCSETVLRSMAGLVSVKKLVLGDISGLRKLDEGIIACLGEVENLSVDNCGPLRYLWEEEVACGVFKKLKSLTVKFCQQLESLGDKEDVLPHNLEILELSSCDNLEKIPNWENSLSSLKRLTINDCKKLQNMASTTDLKHGSEHQGVLAMVQSSSSGKQGVYDFFNLEAVSISGCARLISFPTGKKLPTTLRYLSVMSCENMEELEVGVKGMPLSLLETIKFAKWPNLKSLPEGLAHLTRLCLHWCEGIETISETSLPPTLISLQISFCKNLKYMLCDNQTQSLISLQHLTIIHCENLESYPHDPWPPNLESLTIGDVKQHIKDWGLAKLPTSLLTLQFHGEFPQLVSLSDLGTQLHTTSLTRLGILYLKNLESLWEGLENLYLLQHLYIKDCPKLQELPETLLSMLSSLVIDGCPLMRERCQKEKRDYWPSISHIPCIKIDGELVW